MIMKQFFLLSCLVIALCSGCSSNKDNNNASETAQNVSNSITVDSLLNGAESLTDHQITIEGVCTHTCRHGATKIFVMGSNSDNLIRCEAAALGRFSKDCVHSVVRVTGYVRETRMDEAYLQRWKENYEQALAEQQAQAVAESQFGETSVENDESVSTATGCETESRARREQGATVYDKIKAYRQQIAERKASEGKEYLSFYHIETTSYEIINEQ